MPDPEKDSPYPFPRSPATPHSTPGLLGWGIRPPRSPIPSGLLSTAQAADGTSTPPPQPAYGSIDEAHRIENRWLVLESEAERRKSIIENTPGLFWITDDPNASPLPPRYALPGLGATVVGKNGRLIEEEARRAGVDSDLVRAIMFMEVSQGGGYGYLSELGGFSDSILPMNVRRSFWGPLINNGQPFPPARIEGLGRAHEIDDAKKAFDDPRLNIRAGAILLKRIEQRLQDPSIRNIATLYNLLDRKQVTDYGARVERIYQSREWEQHPDRRK